MTVSTNTAKKNFAGNGSTTAFDLGSGFIFFDETELVVTVRNNTTGAETVQTITTHYTVSGGDGATGTVTMLTAPASGETLIIQRVMPLTQGVDLVNNSSMNAEVMEDALDKLTLADQQLAEAQDRTIKVSAAYSPSSFDPTINPLEAGQYLRINAAGDGIECADGDLNTSTFTQSGTGAVARTVTAKLGESVSVADFGALPDGTDYSEEIQAAIDAVHTAGGGIVHFGPGTYRCKELEWKDKVVLKGASFGATTLKAPDGFDKTIIFNPDQATSTTVDYAGAIDLIFDENKSADAGLVATSAASAAGCTFFYAKNCIFQNATGYGFGFQGAPNQSLPGVQTEVYLENCHFNDNGDGVDAGVTEFDGLDVKDCDVLTLIGCTASGNALDGLDFRGRKITLLNCVAYDNGGAGVQINANAFGENLDSSIDIIGGGYYSNGTTGVSLASGATGTGHCRVNVNTKSHDNATYGCEVVSSGTGGEFIIRGHYYANTSHGIAVLKAHTAIIIDCPICSDNGGSGIYVEAGNILQVNSPVSINNTRYGYEESSLSNGNIVSGAGRMTGNTLGSVLLATAQRSIISPHILDYVPGTGDGIASAATITLPWGGEYFVITGTTNISSVTASWRGRTVTLQFQDILTFTDGSNLILAGDFVTTSNDSITLISDGANWREISRSVN